MMIDIVFESISTCPNLNTTDCFIYSSGQIKNEATVSKAFTLTNWTRRYLQKSLKKEVADHDVPILLISNLDTTTKIVF